MSATAKESISESFKRLKSSPRGITSSEALNRLKQYGKNEFVYSQKFIILKELIRSALSPLILILLLAAFASAIVHNLIDAIIIIIMVAMSAGLNIVQNYRSIKAAEKLKQKTIASVTILRDGQEKEVERTLIVPGDIVILSAGNLVPADCVLVDSSDLHIQEAMLTGESFPVEKNHPTTDSLPDESAYIFLGTSVVSGSCHALVLVTGKTTAFSKIIEQLSEKPLPTEFEKGMDGFSMLILKTVFFLVLFVLLVNLSLGRNPMESMLFSIALAVGLTPEFLPMITTVTLAQGALEMSHYNVIVKHLSAIQNLGSMDILCCDKTGTLTSGIVTLIDSLDAKGNDSKKTLEVAYLNSYFQSGIRNPLESAIMLEKHEVPEDIKRTDEIPFDFGRRRLSVILSRENRYQMISKGSPESILSVCSSYEADGKTFKIDENFKDRFNQILHTIGEKGQRILALAYKDVLRSLGHTVDDEKDLVFCGFIIFSDKLLPGLKEAINSLKNDGVHIKVLTGDNEHVARHVALHAGIDCTSVIQGSEIEEMDEVSLIKAVEITSVFVRVTPAQKYRIIKALKSNKHVVGFIGDGINDAPSLHGSDVGISVSGAVDIAREASDIILTERSLGVLHAGILAGRKSFGNVLKYLLMGTSSNFGNMLSMGGAALFLPFLPMLPIQILLNNFLYDLSQIVIPSDNLDPVMLKTPRRWDVGLIKKFMIYIGPVSSIFDFITFYVLLKIFDFTQGEFQTGWFLESLITQVLVLFVIRTIGLPWRNRPSKLLVFMALFVTFTGVILTVEPTLNFFGFQKLPFSFFLYLFVITFLYLTSVYYVKERIMRKYLT